MKTRSNMPLFVVECEDITKLSDDQINQLRCGDYLVKKTGNQRHAYKVSYKEDGQGICLTYHDASTVETVSYDYSGGHWVYNSTDKALLPLKDGNVYEFDGDLDVDGKITGNEIIENMEGYSATLGASSEGQYEIENVYQGACKNGNKLTIVSAVNFTKINYIGDILLAKFTIPAEIGAKLFPVSSSGSLQYILSLQKINALKDLRTTVQVDMCVEKESNTTLNIYVLSNDMAQLSANVAFYLRIEATFLLSDNLIPEE